MVRHRHFSFAIYLMVFVVLVDQSSKRWVVDFLGLNVWHEVTPWFNLVHVQNKGVTFGLLNNINHEYATYGLIGVAALVVGLLLRWLYHTRSTLVAVALGAIIGGAVGNVIDRVRIGSVIDFLDFHYQGYHWYAFNVADAAIVTGVGLLMLDSLVRGR